MLYLRICNNFTVYVNVIFKNLENSKHLIYNAL